MTTKSTAAIPRRRLGLLLWLAGMLGVVAIVTLLPELLGESPLPAPLWVVTLATFAQSGLLIALAVWSGIALAPQVGLHAPAFEAAVMARSIRSALRPQLLPGLVGGVLGGAGLFAIGGYASPAAFAEVQQRFSVPILARVLYGGITEELLVRWGLMTLLVWLTWRLVQGSKGPPWAISFWLAIVVSALIFGVAHLPAMAMQVGELTGDLVLFVVGANATFAVLFGWLFWRYGLEAAMIAHGGAHAVSYVLSLGAA